MTKKHRPYTTEQYKRAKKAGLKHGYGGIKNGGGWIYSPENKIVCQGWGQFWHKFGTLIRRDEAIRGVGD